jgi:hypothetical protein
MELLVLAAHARASGGRLWGVGKRLCAQRGRLRGWEEHPEAPLPSPFQTAPQRAADQSMATTRWGWTSARGAEPLSRARSPGRGEGRRQRETAGTRLNRRSGASRARKSDVNTAVSCAVPRNWTPRAAPLVAAERAALWKARGVPTGRKSGQKAGDSCSAQHRGPPARPLSGNHTEGLTGPSAIPPARKGAPRPLLVPERGVSRKVEVSQVSARSCTRGERLS